jgi:hypothetical protein
MANQTGPKFEDFSATTILLIFIVGGLVALALALVYFLGLSWLLSVLAPLTFFQATIVAVAMAGSALLVITRIPEFDIPLLLIGLLVSAVLAIVEVFLARLVAWLTPLSVWEASVFVAVTVALTIFLISQIVANAGLENDEDDNLDDDQFEDVIHRLSPDMYVLKPRFDEQPAPKRRRTSRRRSKRKTDESSSD